MKLELGSGQRPTAGYIHSDAHPFDGLDIVADAWDIDLPDTWLDEVIAIAFVEHLRYEHATAVFANVHRMLKPGGTFLFDVPNLAEWCRYFNDPESPFDQAYVLRTLYGWQRWSGDEHKSGWTVTLLEQYLHTAGFHEFFIDTIPREWLARDIYRFRFTRPQQDAHFYVRATA